MRGIWGHLGGFGVVSGVLGSFGVTSEGFGVLWGVLWGSYGSYGGTMGQCCGALWGSAVGRCGAVLWGAVGQSCGAAPIGLLETTVQKVARVKAPNKSLPSAVYCIEDKMCGPKTAPNSPK